MVTSRASVRQYSSISFAWEQGDRRFNPNHTNQFHVAHGQISANVCITTLAEPDIRLGISLEWVDA